MKDDVNGKHNGPLDVPSGDSDTDIVGDGGESQGGGQRKPTLPEICSTFQSAKAEHSLENLSALWRNQARANRIAVPVHLSKPMPPQTGAIYPGLVLGLFFWETSALH
jgi:hypothetical protein